MNEISKEAAAHVLWYFGRGGHQPGSFTEALLGAFAKADNQNFMTLEMAYPEYGLAMFTAKEYAHGIKQLREIAEGE
jgi:hypothetical protein